MKGEFEDRLRKVIQEVQSSERPIILFIDEAHTLIGAGGAEGVGDAANLLKPLVPDWGPDHFKRMVAGWPEGVFEQDLQSVAAVLRGAGPPGWQVWCAWWD